MFQVMIKLQKIIQKSVLYTASIKHNHFCKPHNPKSRSKQQKDQKFKTLQQENRNKNLLFNTKGWSSNIRDGPVIIHKRVTCKSKIEQTHKKIQEKPPRFWWHCINEWKGGYGDLWFELTEGRSWCRDWWVKDVNWDWGPLVTKFEIFGKFIMI